MREWQVPVCLNRESSAPILDTDDCVSVSIDCFFQFHLTGYRLQGSGFVIAVAETPGASVIGHLFVVTPGARVIVRNQDYISVHNGGSFLLCQAGNPAVRHRASTVDSTCFADDMCHN